MAFSFHKPVNCSMCSLDTEVPVETSWDRPASPPMLDYILEGEMAFTYCFYRVREFYLLFFKADNCMQAATCSSSMALSFSLVLENLTKLFRCAHSFHTHFRLPPAMAVHPHEQINATCMCVGVHRYVCMCAYVYMYVCLDAFACVCVGAHMHVSISACVCVHL